MLDFPLIESVRRHRHEGVASHARRSIYPEHAPRLSGKRIGSPHAAMARMKGGTTCEDQRRLAMIVVGLVMAMSMHRPEKVFLEPMRVTVIDDHFMMILNGFEGCRDMRWRGDQGPQRKAQAQKRLNHPSP